MSEIQFGNRLLIVDDEPVCAGVIKKTAERTGFDVVVANDPHEFMMTARSWQPTVISLDLRMPGTDGVQLLRELAADKCPAEIIISSGADDKVMESVMRLGSDRGLKMSATLHKPIKADRLRTLLSGFLRMPKELLAHDLAEAIVWDQLFLEYQPKYDCRLGRFTGVEALVRWRHPSHGIVRPDEFIPLAEETDQIRDLTDWVVRAAAKQSAAWRAQNIALDVAVNVSARDVEDFDLPERLDRHCREAGIDPATMIVELTETGAMREFMSEMDVLTRLRLKGFRLSIDDFGTGYSSLVQLQRMPFSEIKIDRSFVMNMMKDKSCSVVAGIVIELARRLELTSVAEGVEDAAALAALTEMGCNTAQGYHMSKPVSAERVAELVRGATAA